MENKFDEAISGLSETLKSILIDIPHTIKAKTFEIRIRTGCPLMLTLPGRPMFVTAGGEAVNLFRQGVYIVKQADAEESFHALCGYSVHSHQQDIAQGFVTVRGGHRAGLCGTAVYGGGYVTGMKDIYAVNLRVAREIAGAADGIMPLFTRTQTIPGLIIAGPPSSGKTTVLRDLCRRLARGEADYPLKVAVIDERGELACVNGGRAGNDMGFSCDVLTGFRKAEGMRMALRTLSPDVIAFDEIGTPDEADAVIESLNAGVPAITTIHASNISELKQRRQFARLFASNAFAHIAFLKSRDEPSRVAKIYKAGEIFDQADRNSGADTGVLRGGGGIFIAS